MKAACSAAHATSLCFRAGFSCGSLTNLSCIGAIQCLPISSSCLQRDLQGCLAQHKPSYSFFQAAFPCSDTWWLHSEFPQDFGHTRAQESQTTGWRMVVHQQYWHMDKPDSTGKHARSRGRGVDCSHIRGFCGFRSPGQPTKCRYSQLSVSQGRSLTAPTRILLTEAGD